MTDLQVSQRGKKLGPHPVRIMTSFLFLLSIYLFACVSFTYLFLCYSFSTSTFWSISSSSFCSFVSIFSAFFPCSPFSFLLCASVYYPFSLSLLVSLILFFFFLLLCLFFFLFLYHFFVFPSYSFSYSFISRVIYFFPFLWFPYSPFCFFSSFEKG